ncbi:MAG: GntR family transcriptional regulator [Coxiellaceae bacterium]|nr:GntR family transcriptional regulator [Coxiellaceae bacterium]
MAKATLSEQAYCTIKGAILNNEFKPGEKLSICGLKKQYDIGTSPLREALNRLVAKGLLECEQMKGFRVPALSMDDLNDIYHARVLIVLDTLKLVIQNITDEEEAELVAAVHQLTKIEQCEMNTTNFGKWQQKHREFTYALIKGCHSDTMIRLNNRLYDQTERYRRLWFDWSSEHGHVALGKHSIDHQKFVDCVVARDAELLQKTYKDKLMRWLSEMQDCMREYTS